MKIAPTQLIIELSHQVRAGEDVANEDARRLFDWLDRNGGPTWLVYRKRASSVCSNPRNTQEADRG